MYAWTHADFWWRPDEFLLDDVAAEEAARADALPARMREDGER